MSEAKQSLIPFRDPKTAGETLVEVGVDYLHVENYEVISRWFHSEHDSDLLIWMDTGGQIIKQQLSFCGQVVEWNLIDGLKTGVIIEEEIQDQELPSEMIRFDGYPDTSSASLAMEVIRYVHGLNLKERETLLQNFNAKPFKSTLAFKWLRRWKTFFTQD